MTRLKATQVVKTEASTLSPEMSHSVLICARSRRVAKKRYVLTMKDGLAERECSKLDRTARIRVAANESEAAAIETRVFALD